MCLLKFFGSLVYTYRLFVVGTCHRSRPPSNRIAYGVRSDCVRWQWKRVGIYHDLFWSFIYFSYLCPYNCIT